MSIINYIKDFIKSIISPRNWLVVLLFVSAYSPLFFIILLKEEDFLSAIFIIGTIFLVIVNAVWFLIFFMAKQWTRSTPTVKSYSNKTSDSLNYIVAYVIAFLSFEYSTWQDWTSFAILLFIIFIIYASSNLIYVNPILHIFGYKIFDIELKSERIILISKNSYFRTDYPISVRKIAGDIFLEDGPYAEHCEKRT